MWFKNCIVCVDFCFLSLKILFYSNLSKYNEISIEIRLKQINKELYEHVYSVSIQITITLKFSITNFKWNIWT